MEPEDVIRFMELGEVLKRLQRTGWALIGVMGDKGESIADHSFGATLTSLIISLDLHERDESVDIGKVLTMTILHDIPESLISDIPTGADLPGRENLVKAKLQAETKAMRTILQSLGESGVFLEELWIELQKGLSLEARIVQAADMIDMLSHALALERAGMKAELLDEFFTSTKDALETLQIPVVSALYNALLRKHEANLS